MITASLRPAELCRQLLAALDASDGRRRQRKRNTTPDRIGMAIKRELLAHAVREDPEPDAFESWLLERCIDSSDPHGAALAMAREIAAEWGLAQAVPSFGAWLARGAPSDDRSG